MDQEILVPLFSLWLPPRHLLLSDLSCEPAAAAFRSATDGSELGAGRSRSSSREDGHRLKPQGVSPKSLKMTFFTAPQVLVHVVNFAFCRIDLL